MDHQSVVNQLRQCNKAFIQQREMIEYQSKKLVSLEKKKNQMEKEIKSLKKDIEKCSHSKSLRTITLLKNQNKELISSLNKLKR